MSSCVGCVEFGEVGSGERREAGGGRISVGERRKRQVEESDIGGAGHKGGLERHSGRT